MEKKLNLKKIGAILFLGFILLFVLRFCYSLALSDEKLGLSLRDLTVAELREIGTALGSYQIDNNMFPLGYEGKDFLQEGNVNLLQAFVRKAELQTVTNNFEQDKKSFYAVVEEFNAIVKFEQFSGAKKPYRQLRVRVAVPVERFEECGVRFGRKEAQRRRSWRISQ